MCKFFQEVGGLHQVTITQQVTWSTRCSATLPGRRGTDQHQVHVVREVIDVLGEPGETTGHFPEVVPTAHLYGW